MAFRILGPIEVMDDGVPIELGAPKQRALLAVLILHANEGISTDRLIELIWGESPPRTAGHSVQIYVSELRKALDDDGEVILTRRPGYELRVDSEEVDARRFERLVGDAADAQRGGDRETAASLAAEAIALWRGPPLADFAYDEFAQREIRRLEEMRQRAVAILCESQVQAGTPLEAVAMLRDAVARDPLSEEPRRLLMLALFAGGRQAESLRVFRDYRDTLAEETGLEPSPELLRLEEQILLRDPSLATPTATTSARRGAERNPYKGLRAFGEADATDFFGRDRLIRRLLDATTAPFTAVVGPSGSGKSSAVRAGLIPALRAGERSGSHDWTIAVLMPGRYPFAAFDAAMRDAAGSATSASDPTDDASITRSILRSIRTDTGLMLLVVDQFEELFTLTDEATRRAFLRNLITAAEEPRGRIRVLVTVRADFYDRPLLYPEFAKLFAENVVNVLPLTAAGIEAAAVEPAQRVGVGFAPDLLAQLVSDMTDQPGALPLFQYTLTELFDGRDNSVMTLDGYRHVGGLAGALGRRADAVYESLDPDEQETARDVFLRLVKPAGGRHTRRPVPVLELESMGEAVRVSTILTRFGAERLLTFDRDSQTGAATVEVSHEALLSAWSRLAGWLEEARFDLVQLDGLLASAMEWETAGRAPGYLLTGARLADYEAWHESSSIALPPSAFTYLATSTAARIEADRAEAQRRERESKAARRARVRLWGMLAAVVALAAVITFVVVTAIANRPPSVMFGYEGKGGAWDVQMLSGVERAAADFGIEHGVVAATDIGLGLNEIVESSPDLALLGWGGLLVDSSMQTALDHPEIDFVVLDIEPDQELIDARPNVSFAVFAANEGSFLVGAIAASKNETGKIGFIGGVDMPPIWDFRAGFEAGARYVDPTIEITSIYLTQWPDISGYQSPELAAIHARELYESGVDVIYPAAGESGIGVACTARDVTDETGVHRWMIGVDADSYLNWSDPGVMWLTDVLPPYEPKRLVELQPHVLSSMLKRTDTAMYAALEDYANGTFTPGKRIFNLANDGVGYSTSGGYIDDIVADLETMKARIIAGEIHVPTWQELVPPGAGG